MSWNNLKNSLYLTGGNEVTKARKRTRTPAKPQQKSVISPLLIGVVAAAAILVVAGLIILGNQSTAGEPVDISQFPTLGDANAPVTLIEYSDYG